jgi:cobaltochelatase CobS
MQDLSALSYRDLVAVLKHLKGGQIGFDPFRNPSTAKKADLIAYLNAGWMPELIQQAATEALAQQQTPAEPIPPQANPDPMPAQQQQGMAEPAPQAAVPQVPAAAAAQLAALLQTLIPQTPAVDEATVRRVVAEELNKQEPRAIVVKTERTAKRIDGHVHPAFDKILKLASQGVNVLMVGPAGCGKTHLAAMVAEALDLPFCSISYSAGASESWLLGRLLPTGEGGRFEYQESAWCRNYVRPSVSLHDEIDAADPNMLLTLNSGLANGGFDNPVSGLRLKRDAMAIQLACANTFGTGAGAMYVGRSQLDAATLDRWYIVEMDYDRAYEKQLAPRHVTDFVWRLREKAQAAKLRRVISTRAIQKAAAALAAGIEWDDVKADLTRGWTADELAKVA